MKETTYNNVIIGFHFIFGQPGPPSGPPVGHLLCIPIDGGIGVFTFITAFFSDINLQEVYHTDKKIYSYH